MAELADDTDHWTGLILDGRYRIDARVARGGMATVFRGFDTRLNRDVAIKVLHSDLTADDEYRQKFTHEAFSTARLSDPNIVSIFDQSRDGDIIYLVMEYLPGPTLRDLLRRQGALPALAALDVFEPITSGLATAHAAGIIHRDLKPENVLITPDGQVKIADFGLARAATANTGSSESLFGTVAYLAPELLAHAGADERSDIYSLGVMLYEMLTGSQPYHDEQAIQIAYQHVNSDVPLPSSAVPNVPSGLDDLVVWMTRRRPLDRPSDAGQLLEQTRQVREELGYASASFRSFVPLLNADAPAANDTKVLVPTSVSAPPPPAGQAAVSSALPQLAVSADAQLRAALGRRGRYRIWLCALAVALIVGAAFLGWFTGGGPGSPRTVPQLASMSVADATAALEALGLEAQEEQASSLTVPEGQVISTSPDAGALLTRGQSVTLTVSTGPETVVVPNVTGSTVETADAALRQSGFTVADEHQEFFDDVVAAGAVIAAADPDGERLAADARRPQGTQIVLVVSLGPVPDVTGKVLAAAEHTLTQAGLTGARTDQVNSDTVPAGSVVSQSPAQTPIGRGGTVNLTISLGPEMVTVPDVKGKTVTDAMSTLEDAGLSPTTEVPATEVSAGSHALSLRDLLKATSTTPGAGSQVRKGTSVSVNPDWSIN